MFKNAIGTFSLLLAISLIVYVVSDVAIYFRAEKMSRLEYVWRSDIENLRSADALPNFWTQIRTVDKAAADDDRLASSWAKKISLPIEINPMGQYRLEILFMSQESNGKEQAIIQHQVIELESGNTIWELGRTYNLN